MWNRHIVKFAYALRTVTYDSSAKTSAELFLRRQLLTPFERLTFTEHQLMERKKVEFDILIAEAQSALEKALEKEANYYYLWKKGFKINVGDQVLVETHVANSAAKEIVAKFAPNYEGCNQVKEVRVSYLKIEKDGKVQVVNIDQVRIYKDKKLIQNLLMMPMQNTARENGNNTVNGERRVRVSIVENSYRSWHS